jgi:hypothetical protein
MSPLNFRRVESSTHLPFITSRSISPFASNIQLKSSHRKNLSRTTILLQPKCGKSSKTHQFPLKKYCTICWEKKTNTKSQTMDSSNTVFSKFNRPMGIEW